MLVITCVMTGRGFCRTVETRNDALRKKYCSKDGQVPGNGLRDSPLSIIIKALFYLSSNI